MKHPVETAGPGESMLIFSGHRPLNMEDGSSEMGDRDRQVAAGVSEWI